MATRNRSHIRNNFHTTVRDPEAWKTGDDPITSAQRAYIETLAAQAGVELEEIDTLTKAEAAIVIEELHRRTGSRGRVH